MLLTLKTDSSIYGIDEVKLEVNSKEQAIAFDFGRHDGATIKATFALRLKGICRYQFLELVSYIVTKPKGKVQANMWAEYAH
jgi:hypothetical protein